ncbi:MAG: UbiA family prenyltransferase [Candidatus Micrarchaeaceae archaeon]
MIKKIAAILRLTRIEHSLMLVVAVIAAELASGGIPKLPIFALSLVTPIFISMAAFAINDYFDVEVDKANNEKRPLVTGQLTKCEAMAITYACLLAGIAASFLVNEYSFVIAIAFGGLSMAYSYRLKEMLFWGNAYIAFSMAIPFIYGSYVVQSSPSKVILLISAMIFLSGLAREIHGTIRDLKGDTKVRNVRSFAKVIGVMPSAILALVLYAAAIAISISLFYAERPFLLNITYLALIAITDIMLAYLGILYLYKKSAAFYKFSRNLSLAAMALALVTILASQLFPVYI